MSYDSHMQHVHMGSKIMARYLVQDSLYLKQYAKVLALIAAKSEDVKTLLTMSLASHKVSLRGSSRSVKGRKKL